MSSPTAEPTDPQAAAIMRRLELKPHPEGGWYRQSWAAPRKGGARPAGTAIYYLLDRGGRSHWHRVDATEIWHFYAGSPLRLRLAASSAGPAREIRLGPDIHSNQSPQVIVPEGWWQSAHSPGGWALVGCTVSPGFRFEGFELAPPGFDIPGP